MFLKIFSNDCKYKNASFSESLFTFKILRQENMYRLAQRELKVGVESCQLLHLSFHSWSAKLPKKFIASVLQDFEAFDCSRPWIEGHPKPQVTRIQIWWMRRPGSRKMLANDGLRATIMLQKLFHRSRDMRRAHQNALMKLVETIEKTIDNSEQKS